MSLSHKLCSINIRYLVITFLVFFSLVLSAYGQHPFNKSEFVARRTKLFEKIPDGIAVIFAAKEQVYPIKFRQAPDFYYLTGIEEPNAILVLVGASKSSYLFAPKRSENRLRMEGPGIWQVEKREEVYGLTRVVPLENFLPMLTFSAGMAKQLYIPIISQGNVQNGRGELEFQELIQMSHPVLRNIPESKQAISMIQQMVPQLVLQDLNPFLDDLRWIKCILEVRDAVIAAMKPGVKSDKLQDIAEEIYKKHGFHKEFLAIGRYIGHTVGISVHDVEPSDRQRPFEAGVVFNVEPILEIPEKKIHLRLEDTVLITPTGAENMTAGAPARVEEIYELIRQKALGTT